MINSWHETLFPSLLHGALKPFGIGQHFLFFRLENDSQRREMRTQDKTRRDDTAAHLTCDLLNEERGLFIF